MINDLVLKIVRNMIVTSFISILVLSCKPLNTESSEEIIKTMNITLSKNRNDLEFINKWIDKQNYPLPYFLWRNRSDAIGKVHYKNRTRDINDQYFANYLANFIRSSDFNKISVYKDYISYEFSIRNESLISYNLVYFRNDESVKNFNTYQIYQKGIVPKEISGWLYHLKENWYVKSPVDEKFITDSLRKESRYKEHFVKSFKYKFNGVITEKKSIEGNLKLIKLKLKTSGISYFEPRDSLNYFFCIIDYPFADILYNEEFIKVNVDDSISFNNDNLNYYNVSKIGEEPIYNIKPAVIEYSKFKHKIIFSIPKYRNHEKLVKLETNNYKRNKSDKIFRFYLGKYKTSNEFKQLKEKYHDTYLIDNCLINKTYLEITKGETKLLFTNLKLYSLKHISKYLNLINKMELKVGVFNKDDELLKIYKRVQKYPR